MTSLPKSARSHVVSADIPTAPSIVLYSKSYWLVVVLVLIPARSSASAAQPMTRSGFARIFPRLRSSPALPPPECSPLSRVPAEYPHVVFSCGHILYRRILRYCRSSAAFRHPAHAALISPLLPPAPRLSRIFPPKAVQLAAPRGGFCTLRTIHGFG